jgi:valyl-tRNA synthetase
MGRDIKLSAERIEGYPNFANTIWNAARFVLMNLEAGAGAHERPPAASPGVRPGPSPGPGADVLGLPLNAADRWILSRLDHAVADVRAALDGYEFNAAAGRLYEFIWHEYCDWYVELSKLALAGDDAGAADAARAVLATVLETSLRLLHPFMPFLTEELWQHLPAWARQEREAAPAAHLTVAAFPVSRPERRDGAAEATIGRLIDIIRAVRNLRAELNLPPAERLDVRVFAADGTVRAAIEAHRRLVETQARVTLRDFVAAAGRPADSVVAALDGIELYVAVRGLIDVAAEQRRLEKEIGKVAGELAGVTAKLGNPQFVERAPEEVVEKERAREARLRERQVTLDRGIARLRELT